MTTTVPHSLPFDQPDAFIEGQVMIIDKPLSWTSFDVVNKVRYALRGFTGVKKIKVGHAGTLDPLATGVLVVCCGRATKPSTRSKRRPRCTLPPSDSAPTHLHWMLRPKLTGGPPTQIKSWH